MIGVFIAALAWISRAMMCQTILMGDRTHTPLDPTGDPDLFVRFEFWKTDDDIALEDVLTHEIRVSTAGMTAFGSAVIIVQHAESGFEPGIQRLQQAVLSKVNLHPGPVIINVKIGGDTAKAVPVHHVLPQVNQPYGWDGP